MKSCGKLWNLENFAVVSHGILRTGEWNLAYFTAENCGLYKSPRFLSQKHMAQKIIILCCFSLKQFSKNFSTLLLNFTYIWCIKTSYLNLADRNAGYYGVFTECTAAHEVKQGLPFACKATRTIRHETLTLHYSIMHN